MLTPFERILLPDGTFGCILKQVARGAGPLYLVVAFPCTELIVGAGDFRRTDWDGIERRREERRKGERRKTPARLEPSERERRGADRRKVERRQFVVRRAAGPSAAPGTDQSPPGQEAGA